MESEDRIKLGKYEFVIKESIMKYGDRIINHTFKIGGTYNNCIGVSYNYINNIPTSAKIPHALYEPECSLTTPLDKGIGTIIMLKTLLEYSYKKINSVTTFSFDDMSHIDCIDKNMTKQIPRKPSQPLNLAYFSIAYNSETWYEKHFNATMIDDKKYKKYRERLDFLTNPTKMESFVKFLEISKPNPDQYDYLEKLYTKSSTYREFFELIPKSKRCEILYSWLSTFMNYYLHDVFSTNDWQINILHMNSINGSSSGGSIRKNPYPLKYNIISHKTMHNF